MLYFIVTLAVAFVLLFLLLLFTWKNRISPMPTSSKMRQALLKSLPELQRGTVIELGSGWGHLLFPLSKKYGSCQIVGYENSPIPYFFSSLANYASNIKIFRSDFFEKPLCDANLIVCYLFPTAMARLKVKLEKELKPGAQVVSHTYAIPSWEPKQVIAVGDSGSNIYLYEML